MTATRVDTQLGGITDLTLLTPIKAGFVEAPEPISYVARLRMVLRTINAMRMASREASDPPPPFTDVVTRFRIVHSFRWAVIDPPPGSDQPARLLLNVCFDGGWEPYMRVIWRDLGTTLDLILCHSVDYQLSRDIGFAEYARWVRANEVPADFLYIESQRTVMDHEYLARAEAQARSNGADDLAAVRLRTPSPGDYPALPGSTPATRMLGLAALAGVAALHAMQRYFTIHPNKHADGWCLLRAAHDILFELRKLDTAKLFPPGDPVRDAFYEMLDWFERPTPALKKTPQRLTLAPSHVQGGILTGYPDLVGGEMVLLMVQPGLEKQALAWLARLAVTTEEDTTQGRIPPDQPYCNLSLSLAGLIALGAQDELIATLPQAFREGMEQRAGVLGDLRSNHPQHWNVPRAPNGNPVDPSTVHVVLQLRWRAGGALAAGKFIGAIDRMKDGLILLHRQPMVRNTGPGGVTQEAFGFVDGISQPVGTTRVDELNPIVAGQQWTDEVPCGELLLGYRTSRDAAPVPVQANPLLDNGSFLVIRKLRQQVGRFSALVAAQAQALGLPTELLKAKMMGRWPDGRPLVGGSARPTNDFNYASDPQASKCPFHAHVRRANPRDMGATGQAAMPRLLRRGMSYGAPGDADRGLIFMAYNANIAEQFEVVQRWMAGANSSGGYAGQPDPFLGVPTAGESRVMTFEHEGRSYRLDLGDQPLVELQWGGYYFAPSIPALKDLAQAMADSTPAKADPPPLLVPDTRDAKAWQVWVESRETADIAWDYVRRQGGVVDTAYGVMVGSDAQVQEVLRDRGGRFSVSGYGARMRSSIGLGFLGEDPDLGHDQHAPLINTALWDVSEKEGFELSYAIGKGVLGVIRSAAQSVGMTEAPVDIEAYAGAALAQLTTHWFGVPDGKRVWGLEPHKDNDTGRRCPAGFMYVSRHVFGPEPRPEVSELGMAAGKTLKEQTAQWLRDMKEAGKPLPDLSAKIVAAATPFVSDADPDFVERTLAGIILGFAPTVLGNVEVGYGGLVYTRALWSLQAVWSPGQDPFAAAGQVLRPALTKTLVQAGVPASVWRIAASDTQIGEVKVAKGQRLIIGLVSAMTQNPDHFTAFGGPRPEVSSDPTIHACSGYNMGMGVLQGLLAALLEAGVLRPTASPLALTWQL